MQNIDITIVGAGSAGLTLALLLAPLGLNIVVLEQGPEPVVTVADYRRVSALNLASQRVLAAVGVWPGIAASASAYQQMQVWEADSFARIDFDAASQRLSTLGWICDNEQIRQQLYLKLQQFHNVQCWFNSRISQLNQNDSGVLVQLADQRLLLSQLLIGADGVNSFVRQQQQLALTHWDYQQQALVATVRTEQEHGATARQVFLPEGPLALLPLPDPHLCSIVWSCSPQRAEQLLQMSPAAFGQALTAASQSVLGVITTETAVQSFPLKMRYARQWVRQRVVLVADAAHSIHPLAGQGMNLGLMDVAALAELIAKQYEASQPLAELRLLRQYERWRKAEAQTMIAAMEAFKQGFGQSLPLLKLVRSVGMNAVNNLPWLKQQIIAAALGNSGDLPQVARHQPERV